MGPDDQGQKGPSKKDRHPHQRWREDQRGLAVPRSWSNKTMHHPAMRIGEMKHGKS